MQQMFQINSCVKKVPVFKTVKMTVVYKKYKCILMQYINYSTDDNKSLARKPNFNKAV